MFVYSLGVGKELSVFLLVVVVNGIIIRRWYFVLKLFLLVSDIFLFFLVRGFFSVIDLNDLGVRIFFFLGKKFSLVILGWLFVLIEV